jgi:hypothetical protein
MTHYLTPAMLTACPWASCGPVSLAALLNRPIDSLGLAFPNQTPENHWTNWGHMLSALHELGVQAEETGLAGTVFPPGVRPAPERLWPERGIVLIQFRGGWDAMPVNHPAQLHRSHFVAITPLLTATGEVFDRKDPMVFDINVLDADLNGGWTPRSYWEARVATILWSGFQPRGQRARSAWSLPEGARGWWVRAAVEIRP